MPTSHTNDPCENVTLRELRHGTHNCPRCATNQPKVPAENLRPGTLTACTGETITLRSRENNGRKPARAASPFHATEQPDLGGRGTLGCRGSGFLCLVRHHRFPARVGR